MNKKTLALVIISSLVLVIWLIKTNIKIISTRIEIKNSKIPPAFDGYKIALLADFHNNPRGGKVLEKIKEEKPHMIGISGDFVDSRDTDFDLALDFIKDIKELAPIYQVTGNHESRIADYDLFQEELKNLGVNIMDNKALFIEKGESRIQVLGLKDPDFSGGKADFSILEKEISHEDFSILLSHRPEIFESYVKLGANLVLTGHVHGGQVRIPFLGALIAPDQGFFPEYSEGLYSKDKTSMLVSRGLGNSIIPLRVNNPPELIIIELVSTS